MKSKTQSVFDHIELRDPQSVARGDIRRGGVGSVVWEVGMKASVGGPERGDALLVCVWGGVCLSVVLLGSGTLLV